MVEGLRFAVPFVSGVVVAIWSVAALFHLFPVNVQPFAWWHFPWIATVIFAVGLPLAATGFAVGCWWSSK